MENLMLFPVPCWEKERTFEINNRALARFCWVTAGMCHAAHWQYLGMIPNELCSLGIAFTGLELVAEHPVWGLLSSPTVSDWMWQMKRIDIPVGVWNPRESCTAWCKDCPQSWCFSCLSLFVCYEKNTVPLLSQTAYKSPQSNQFL